MAGQNTVVTISLKAQDAASGAFEKVKKQIDGIQKSLAAIDPGNMEKVATSLNKIGSLSEGSGKNLKELINALGELKTSKKTSDNISKLGEAVQQLKVSPQSGKNLAAFGKALAKTGEAAATVPSNNNLKKLAEAIALINQSATKNSGDKLTNFGKALKALVKGMNAAGTANLGKFKENLNELQKVANKLNSTKLTTFKNSLAAIGKVSTANFGKNTKSLGEAIGVLKQNLDGINTASLKRIGTAFVSLKEGANAATARAIKSVAAALTTLKDVATSTLATNVRSLATSLQKVGQSSGFRDLASQVRQLKTDFAKMQQATQKTVSSVASVGNAATQATPKIRSAREELKALINQSALTSFANIVDAFVALRAAVGAFQPAVEFESAMAKVAGISRATSTEMAELRDKALEMGRTTIFGAHEAAEGLQILAQAGFDAKTSMEVLPNVMNLAAAGGISVKEATDIATSSMYGFGIAVEDLEHLLDAMAETAASSNTSVAELGQALRTAAPVARAAGESMETTLAVLGAFGNAGLKGSNAGHNFKRMLLRLVEPTKKTNEALAELGVSLYDAEGQFRGVIDVLEDLDKGGLNISQAKRIFGMWSAAASVAATQQIQFIKETEAELKYVDGALNQMALTMTDTVAGAFKRFKDSMTQAFILVMESALEATKGFILQLKNLVAAFDIFLNGNSGLATFIRVGGASLVIVTGLTAAFGLFMSVSFRVARAIGNLITMVGTLNKAMTASLVSLRGHIAAYAWYTAEIIKSAAATAAETTSKIAGAAASKLKGAADLYAANASKIGHLATIRLMAAEAIAATGRKVYAAITKTLTFAELFLNTARAKGIKVAFTELVLQSKLGVAMKANIVVTKALAVAKWLLLTPIGLITTALIGATVALAAYILKSKDGRKAMEEQAKASREAEIRIRDLFNTWRNADRGSTERITAALELKKALQEQGKAAGIADHLIKDAVDSIDGLSGEILDNGVAFTKLMDALADSRAKQVEERLAGIASEIEKLQDKLANGAFDEDETEIDVQLNLIKLREQESQFKQILENIKERARQSRLDIVQEFTNMKLVDVKTEEEFQEFLRRIPAGYTDIVNIVKDAYNDMTRYGDESATQRAQRLAEELAAEKAHLSELKEERFKLQEQLENLGKTNGSAQLRDDLLGALADVDKKIAESDEKAKGLGVKSGAAMRKAIKEASDEYEEASKKAKDFEKKAKAAFDAVIKRTKKAYDDTKKYVNELVKGIADINAAIEELRTNTASDIRDIARQNMSEEAAWYDERKEAEEKIAAAAEKRAEAERLYAEAKKAASKGDVESAAAFTKQAEEMVEAYKDILDDARDLAKGLAREVSKENEDGKDTIVKSMKETSSVATQLLKDIERLGTEGLTKIRSAAEGAEAGGRAELKRLAEELQDLHAKKDLVIKIGAEYKEAAKERLDFIKEVFDENGAFNKENKLNLNVDEANDRLALLNQKVENMKAIQIKFENSDFFTKIEEDAERAGNIIGEKMKGVSQIGVDVTSVEISDGVMAQVQTLDGVAATIDIVPSTLRTKKMWEDLVGEVLGNEAKAEISTDKATMTREGMVVPIKPEDTSVTKFKEVTAELVVDGKKHVLVEVPANGYGSEAEIRKKFAELTKTEEKLIRIRYIETNKPDTKSRGGAVRRMAGGGQLPGGDSKFDSVPVLARPGEWFIRNESVKHWNSSVGDWFMRAINEPFSGMGQRLTNSLKSVRMAQGGQVPAVRSIAGAAGAGGAQPMGTLELSVGGGSFPVTAPVNVIEALTQKIRQEKLLKGGA